jgi:three-Cys-motif partner protein
MSEILWPREPHTGAKHAILRRYLNAWLPKLSWAKRLIFIDGFAGPGEYAGGEPGSPQVALDAAINHSAPLSGCELRFLFIEAEETRFQHLDALIKGLATPPHIKAKAVHGTFDETTAQGLDQLSESGRALAPALVMVDPFGPKGLPMALLKRIAANPHSELLISLMYEPIARFRRQLEFERHLDALYGTPQWRDVQAQTEASGRRDFLHALYVEQLKNEAGLKFVTSFELRDSGNRVEYFLIHATNNIEGLKAMKEAMWNVDRTGTFSFSDATVGRGPTLFELGPDFHRLRGLIASKFTGRSAVSVEEVEEFVLVDTPFRETHYKTQVLKPMEDEGLLEVVSHGPRRRGTYPLARGLKLNFRQPTA